MLGKSAVKIARSVEGISVDDDGSVTAITGDRRAVVETLSEQYREVLGSAAENRLLAAAREFEDDVVLPPSLGGPDPHADTTRDGPVQEPATVDPAVAGPTATDSSADAMSDGGTVAVQSPGGTDEPADAVDEPTDRVRADEALQEVASIPEPVKVEYTVTSSIPDVTDTDTDLGSVYLMPLADDGWQTPVSIADAVAWALSDATGLSSDDIDAFVDAIEPDRRLTTLDGENGETVSFQRQEITVTFHRTGSLAVH